jgi:hypothetical protein
LAGLCAAVQAARVRAGQLPEDLAGALERVLADALAIGQRYVREQQAEAARGWDVRTLLRGLQACVRRYADNARCLAGDREGGRR